MHGSLAVFHSHVGQLLGIRYAALAVSEIQSHYPQHPDQLRLIKSNAPYFLGPAASTSQYVSN